MNIEVNIDEVIVSDGGLRVSEWIWDMNNLGHVIEKTECATETLARLKKAGSEEYFEVPGPGNYYGGLHIAKHEGKYLWMIENYDSDPEDPSDYIECPEYVYESLKKYCNEQV